MTTWHGSLSPKGQAAHDPPEFHVVTGAFSYTGKYITQRLLAKGRRVKTLTGHPTRHNPFGQQVSVAPLDFNDPGALRENLRGATTLYNTYWIRFPYGPVTFEKAVENSRTLFKAAEEAGIRRIAHISIINASEEVLWPYFSGKGQVEKALINSGLSYAIIRPTVIFGAEDVLINNIAWLLRRLPVFAVFGTGRYRVQPVYVGDLAEIAVEAANQEADLVLDAAGPEVFTFEELVRLLAQKVGSRAKIVHLPPGPALLLGALLGYLVRDVVLTRDEVEGLMAELLVSQGPPTGHTRLSHWLDANGDNLGTSYASELDRHYR